MRKLISIILVLATGVVFAADDPARTISVSGTGSVELAPDKATLVLSIVAREADVETAQSKAAEVTAKVLALADDLNIERNLVDTTSASVRPDYRWNRDSEEQELRGYIAERQMRIEVRDLEQLGVVIERAVKAGVNQVMPPQLDSSNRRDAYRDALDKAALDAKETATRLAASLDLKLGSAIQVNAGSNIRPPVPMFGGRQVAMAMSDEAAARETYNAADMKVSATISVVFELVDD
jgi:uncharacterized protein YggE